MCVAHARVKLLLLTRQLHSSLYGLPILAVPPPPAPLARHQHAGAQRCLFNVVRNRTAGVGCS